MALEERTSKLAIEDQMAASDAENTSSTPSTATEPPPEAPAAAKPKRVRTGCLTCRERHLKCDEGLPVCQNCKRSSRTCKRGVRLNFIDTKVGEEVPQSSEWSINFQDESRDIASEYKGGAGRYTVSPEDEMEFVQGHSQAQFQAQAQAQAQAEAQAQVQAQAQAQAQGQAVMNVLNAPVMSHQPLPSMQSPPVPSFQDGHAPSSRRESVVSNNSPHSTQSSHAVYASSQYAPSEPSSVLTTEARDCLTSPEETLFMQVFVEEVGLWMDSMDPHKHVSTCEFQSIQMRD